MKKTVFFRRFLSVAQKTSLSSSPYGEGFNYWVEAGFDSPLALDEAELEKRVGKVLGRLDHRSLGVDLDLGFEPTSTGLAEWIFAQVESEAAPARLSEVRLLRGDGYEVFSKKT